MSDFEREERAFRAALARAADGFEPRKLAIPGGSDTSASADVSEETAQAEQNGQNEQDGQDGQDEAKGPVRRRATWILAAAAAVLAVVGLGGVVANLQPAGSGGESTAASDAGGAEDRSAGAPEVFSEEDGAAPEGTYTDGGRTDLPAPAEGNRWAVRYDVAFQVPEEWADATAPALPECIAEPGDQWDTVPRTPYVANITNQPVPKIACNETEDRDFPPQFGKVPFALWQPYVLIEKPGEGASLQTGSWEHEGWLLTRVQVGDDAYATILTGPGDDQINYEIKGSLRTTPKDPYGCETASPLAEGDPVRPKTEPSTAPLEGDDPESIAVCRYEPSSASLTGSREITGTAAAGLVEAIRSAPSGSGPNTPQNCAPGQPVTAYVILRIFRDGEPGDVYVNYENCDDHGFYDGITVRELTPAACRPVFAEEPVTIYSAQGDVAKVCLS